VARCKDETLKTMNIRSYRITFVLIFLVLVAAQPLLYRSIALSPDEGYFMFMGKSISNGAVPYITFADNKPPGIWYLLFAAFQVFGKSLYVARGMTYAANAFSALLLYFTGKELWNEKAGMISSLVFLFGMVIPAFEGYYVLTEPFLALFSILGFLFFIKANGRIPYLIASGAAIGVAALFKQTGILPLLAIFLFYLLSLWIPANRNRTYLLGSLKGSLLVISGFVAPLLVVAAYFWSQNALSQLVNYSIFGLRGYGTVFNILSLGYEFLSFSIVWTILLIAFCVVVYRFISKRTGLETLIAIWLLVSFLPLAARQYGHYFIQVLPPASLLFAWFVMELIAGSSSTIRGTLKRYKKAYLPATAVAIVLIIASMGTSAYGYLKNSGSAYSLQAQIETSDYIRVHTVKNDKILVYPYQPSIYFLSARDPCAKMLFLSPSVVGFNAEAELLEQISEYSPEYVVMQTDEKGRLIMGLPGIYKFIVSNYHPESTIGTFAIYRNDAR
jgi:4-amino-4-deoxy-L-arabinose transferase-like glycosyltransferase